ncbi:MAG: malto-oligosyltrehalose trehalohydrolase [Acidobacteriota bacterium]
MHRFEVWAPFAKRVAVQVNGSAWPMESRGERGWWRLDAAEADAGSEYGFLIDDDPKPYPDPRSQGQPHGVHGLSRIYNQTAFAWTDAAFRAPALASGIVYELHVGAFTPEGTLNAAIGKLDALAELGITHVELMPVAAFAGNHGWGYDGVALYAVHEPYGGPDALKRFVNAAHERGLAVLLDVVYNHFGPVGNYTGKYGPYILDTHHTPWGGAVNLEGPGAFEVRRFLLENARMWLRDFHMDGLRLDAVHAFVDRSAIHFLEQLAAEVDALEAETGRTLALIAESDLNDPRVVAPREAGGLGMDAQWSDDFHHALFTVLTGLRDGYYADFGSMGQLAQALEHTFVYDGIYSNHRRRVHGRPLHGTSQHRFLGYIQDHDQVGNRAVGDRIHQIAGLERARIAAAIVLLSPFIPMIFQGEEWACSAPFQFFADHEPEMARKVSVGRKQEFAAFGWDPEQIPDPERRETFERCKLKWEELAQREHAAMREWYRALIRLRRTWPCLNNGERGNIQVTYSEQEKWLQFRRGQIALCCNLGAAEHAFSVAAGSRILLASRQGVAVRNGSVAVPADSVAVLHAPQR